MVKYSKYLLTLIGLFVAFQATAQMSSDRFSPLQRDLEVTRVTLENYLKRWGGEMMLNHFDKAEAKYQKGQGVIITVEANNADIYMSVHNGSFRNADDNILDTFFSDDMINLQKQRLEEAIKSFFEAYKSYLPKLDGGEKVTITFDVKDRIRKQKNGKQQEPTPLAHKRTYKMAAEISASDLENYKAGSLSEEAFNRNMKINYSNE